MRYVIKAWIVTVFLWIPIIMIVFISVPFGLSYVLSDVFCHGCSDEWHNDCACSKVSDFSNFCFLNSKSLTVFYWIICYVIDFIFFYWLFIKHKWWRFVIDDSALNKDEGVVK